MLAWFREHNTEITWFIIGFLTWSSIDSLSKGNYILAAIDAGLIVLNYKLWADR